ncbi:MAG: 3-oxoacyl-ACP reductase FabG [Fibrobacterales bacterium]
MSRKVALITGASRGIGKAIALDLAKNNIDVILTYLNNKEKAQEVVESITQQGGRACSYQLNTADSIRSRELSEELISTFGRIDFLVNNAGMAQEKPFSEISDDDWDTMFSVNLKGPFVLTQSIIPKMIEQGYGRVVNVVSIGGQWGGFNQVHYAASKAGLINFTQSMAKIYSGKGITINAVSPGLISTDMVSKEVISDAGKKKIEGIPIGRVGSVDEVAKVVTFLCSEDASYITGQTINVNGGMYFG